MVLLLGL